ncbi:hypothetical protein N9452_04125 [Alphaproteobacteria bacterium]|jgi:hypothetical protein|nr:hypothetical protein [Alphaproteobacteria bacterium]
MKKAASALFLIFFLSACAETVDTVFRPDFGAQPSDPQSRDKYSPPSAASRIQAAQTATKTGSAKHNPPPKINHYSTSLGQPAENSNLPLSPPAGRPIPSGVNIHYEQQLRLQKRDTTPSYPPNNLPPKERSWFGSIFGNNDPEPQSNASSKCYSGKLTTEGVSCQAMRTNKGRLLTLGGPLRGFRAGDVVCVCGPVAKTSFCQQGTTIYLAQIGVRCDTP